MSRPASDLSSVNLKQGTIQYLRSVTSRGSDPSFRLRASIFEFGLAIKVHIQAGATSEFREPDGTECPGIYSSAGSHA